MGDRQDYSQVSFWEKESFSDWAEDSSNSGKTSTHFYKPPYVGRFSKIAHTKLGQLLKRYCKADLDIKLVISTFKLRNMFSVKFSTAKRSTFAACRLKIFLCWL